MEFAALKKCSIIDNLNMSLKKLPRENLQADKPWKQARETSEGNKRGK